MKFIDMFAGLGGFHLGLERLGHECVFSCEKNPKLRELYEQNFSIKPSSDIRELKPEDIPKHDIFCGGFPCQPFSKAGEQLGLSCENDGDLFENIIRILKYHKPKFILLENVANLLKHNNGETFSYIESELISLGYNIDRKILSPHSFGIPQRRDRLFIIGSKEKLNSFTWPKPNNIIPSIFNILDSNPSDAKVIPKHYRKCLNVWQEFIDKFPKDQELPSFPIWSMEFGANYPYENEIPYSLSARQLRNYKGTFGEDLKEHTPTKRLSSLPRYAQAESFPPWKQQFIRQNRELYSANKSWIDKWLPKIKEFPSSLQKLEWNCKGEERIINNYIIQFRASGVRIKRPTTAPALIAMTTTQVPIIASENRYMTVKECSRLQGMESLKHFPETEIQAYRALGNAVNADLVEMIGTQLLSSIPPL